MHDWSDQNVDWEGISSAAEYIAMRLRRWGRVSVTDYKEKFGTVRVYCNLGWTQFHSVFKPGYVYSQWPRWLWSLDCRYGYRILQPLNRIVVPFHAWLYTDTYKRAIRKWPHLRLEILNGADYSHLLGPCGVHMIRESQNSSTIYIDWAPGEPDRNALDREVDDGDMVGDIVHDSECEMKGCDRSGTMYFLPSGISLCPECAQEVYKALNAGVNSNGNDEAVQS